MSGLVGVKEEFAGSFLPMAPLILVSSNKGDDDLAKVFAGTVRWCMEIDQRECLIDCEAQLINLWKSLYSLKRGPT